MKKLMTLVIMLLTLTLALPTTVEAAAKPKLTKTSVKTQKNKKVTVKIKNGKIKSVKTSNKKVASVSYKAYKKNKKNTGLSFTIKGGSKNGKATITVKTTKGKTLKCKVTNKVKSSKPKQPTPPAPTPEPTPVPPAPTPEPPAPAPEPPVPTPTPEEPEPAPEEPEEPEEPEPKYYFRAGSLEEVERLTLGYFKNVVSEEDLRAYYYGYFAGVWENAFDANISPKDISVTELRTYYDTYAAIDQGERLSTAFEDFNTALSNAKGMKPVIQQILAMTEGKSDYDKCFAIGDWYSTTEYDYAEQCNYYAPAIFIKKKGVCQAYKEATEIILSILGIKYDVYQVPGHTWIVACPNGKAVTLDTWDVEDGAKTSIPFNGVPVEGTIGNGNMGSWASHLSSTIK